MEISWFLMTCNKKKLEIKIIFHYDFFTFYNFIIYKSTNFTNSSLTHYTKKNNNTLHYMKPIPKSQLVDPYTKVKRGPWTRWASGSLMRHSPK